MKYEDFDEEESDSVKKKRNLEKKLKKFKQSMINIKVSGLLWKTRKSIGTGQRNCLITTARILGKEEL